MKKFEPHYRLVRVGMATKIEKASRQQRTSRPKHTIPLSHCSAVAEVVDEICWDDVVFLHICLQRPAQQPMLTCISSLQASKGRTGRRSSVAWSSPSVSARRNRRLALELYKWSQGSCRFFCASVGFCFSGGSGRDAGNTRPLRECIVFSPGSTDTSRLSITHGHGWWDDGVSSCRLIEKDKSLFLSITINHFLHSIEALICMVRVRDCSDDRGSW